MYETAHLSVTPVQLTWVNREMWCEVLLLWFSVTLSWDLHLQFLISALLFIFEQSKVVFFIFIFYFFYLRNTRSGNNTKLGEHDHCGQLFICPGALFSVVASTEVLAATVAMIVYPDVYYPLALNTLLKSATLYILLAILCIIPASLLL